MIAIFIMSAKLDNFETVYNVITSVHDITKKFYHVNQIIVQIWSVAKVKKRVKTKRQKVLRTNSHICSS